MLLLVGIVTLCEFGGEVLYAQTFVSEERFHARR